MRNIALILRYDGSRYHGWQVQKNEISVAQTLEEAAEQDLRPQGKGRGLRPHRRRGPRPALLRPTSARIPAYLWTGCPWRWNSRLPEDIAVLEAVEAPEDFNAIGSCIKKEYIYKILNSNIRDPFLEKRVCFYPQHLDMGLMQRAAKAFEGTHDFRAVRSEGTKTKTTVRTVHWCRAEKEGELITVSICADGFLYNMCRAMVGTMVYASYGKLLPEDIPGLLEKGDRRLTGPTMPPQGLYLNRVWYEGAVGEMFSRY